MNCKVYLQATKTRSSSLKITFIMTLQETKQEQVRRVKAKSKMPKKMKK